MLSFLTHNYYCFKRQEIWFPNGNTTQDVHYNVYSACENKPLYNVELLMEYQTSLIDLTKSTDKLFQQISKTFRYHIRKLQKETFLFVPNFNPSYIDCKQLILSYNLFAKQIGIRPISGKRIFALQKINRLCITKIFFQDIELITHIYLFDDSKALLLHTFHNISFNDNRLRGYANKYAHWEDILLFKEKGFMIYDLGGIDMETLKGISNFKLSFGGNIHPQYSYIKTSPLINKMVNIYKQIHG